MSLLGASSLSRTGISPTVGEEGEDEEDEEEWLSCLESVLGTKMGTKFYVLHCIRIPF